MAPKLGYLRMDNDDLAWERGDEALEAWEKSLHKAEAYRAIAELIKKYRPGDAVELHVPIRGGYNVFWRLEYKDGSSAAMRIPSEGIVKFPEEKVRYEVATMRYIAANTTIPVPEIYGWGTAEENPTGLGSFIIMEHIKHERTLSQYQRTETRASLRTDGQYPSPAVDLTFPRIGSLTQDADGQFSVSGRPLIMNMNSLIEFSTVPPSVLPTQPHNYSTTDEWYSALADMHLAQITFQHNDAVTDEDDARDKYVARQLYRRLAREGRLTSSSTGENDCHDEGPRVRLFSEDLRPSNVLVDKDDCVVGVIDWEFAYAAPEQFTFDPPWWLLLTSPDYWDDGYGSFMETYEPRLATFLRVLEAEEKKMRDSSRDVGGGGKVVLSEQMRRGWESKTWMISLAARNSWAFDFLFWRFLDGKFFGENEDQDHHARLHLLTEREREAMEPFVAVKVEEEKERILVEWDEERAAARLAEVMV
ncbi:hypothetical protein VE02_03113 [Pseudogymnoascus sp. 03VT05]|nr:hypothetical protein VE02_03113 [Pseudogymnoascus sp. 03VT05]